MMAFVSRETDLNNGSRITSLATTFDLFPLGLCVPCWSLRMEKFANSEQTVRARSSQSFNSSGCSGMGCGASFFSLSINAYRQPFSLSKQFLFKHLITNPTL